MKQIRIILPLVLLAFAPLGLCTTAVAQTFPSKPIRMVVPFPPGGGIDALGRIMAAGLTERLGQPITIENRAGAGGLLAAELLYKSPADGHLLLCHTHSTFTVLPHMFKKLPFDPMRDFLPLMKAVTVPMVVTVTADSPIGSMRALLEQARVSPGKLSYGTSVPGSTMQVLLEELKQAAGGDYLHVNYKGGQPVVNDVLAGVLQFAGLGLPNVEGLIRSGRLRALAVLANERSNLMPNVPSIPEATGYKLTDYTTWYGFAARTGVQPDVAARLKREMREVLIQPGVRAKLAGFTMEVVALPQEQFAHTLGAELAAYGAAFRKLGIEPE